MRKTYDRDTKLVYIDQVENGLKTVPEAAQELGVSEATIYNWRKQLRDDPFHGLPGSGRQKPDIEYQRKLERENSQLKKELEFLKKAAAYFASDQKKNTR